MRPATEQTSFQTHSHARTLHIPDSDAAEVRDRLAYALDQNGFSILAEIDLSEILRRRLGAPAPALDLTAAERATLIEAVAQRRHALLIESAGTEKHDLQHALAQNIEQLDSLIRKLGQPELRP